MRHKINRPVPITQMVAVRALRHAAEGWGIIGALTSEEMGIKAPNEMVGGYVAGVCGTTKFALQVAGRVVLDAEANMRRNDLSIRASDGVDQCEWQECIDALSDLADFLAPEPNQDERAAARWTIPGEIDEARDLIYNTMEPEQVVALAYEQAAEDEAVAAYDPEA
jgi:hypothetical protein